MKPLPAETAPPVIETQPFGDDGAKMSPIMVLLPPAMSMDLVVEQLAPWVLLE